MKILTARKPSPLCSTGGGVGGWYTTEEGAQTLSLFPRTSLSAKWGLFHTLRKAGEERDHTKGKEPDICRPLEKAMAPHSSTLAWKIPWMEEPGRLQSMGSLRVGHD